MRKIFEFFLYLPYRIVGLFVSREKRIKKITDRWNF